MLQNAAAVEELQLVYGFRDDGHELLVLGIRRGAPLSQPGIHQTAPEDVEVPRSVEGLTLHDAEGGPMSPRGRPSPRPEKTYQVTLRKWRSSRRRESHRLWQAAAPGQGETWRT